jgi:hypothetical protein
MGFVNIIERRSLLRFNVFPIVNIRDNKDKSDNNRGSNGEIDFHNS